MQHKLLSAIALTTLLTLGGPVFAADRAAAETSVDTWALSLWQSAYVATGEASVQAWASATAQATDTAAETIVEAWASKTWDAINNVVMFANGRPAYSQN